MKTKSVETKSVETVIMPSFEASKRKLMTLDGEGNAIVKDGVKISSDAVAAIVGGLLDTEELSGRNVRSFLFSIHQSEAEKKADILKGVWLELAKTRHPQTVAGLKQTVTGIMPALAKEGLSLSEMGKADYLRAFSNRLLLGEKGKDKKVDVKAAKVLVPLLKSGASQKEIAEKLKELPPLRARKPRTAGDALKAKETTPTAAASKVVAENASVREAFLCFADSVEAHGMPLSHVVNVMRKVIEARKGLKGLKVSYHELTNPGKSNLPARPAGRLKKSNTR